MSPICTVKTCISNLRLKAGSSQTDKAFRYEADLRVLGVHPVRGAEGVAKAVHSLLTTHLPLPITIYELIAHPWRRIREGRRTRARSGTLCQPRSVIS